MIAADQPTIFDTHKVRVVVSDAADGNTRHEWGPEAEVQQAIAGIAKAAGVPVDRIVVMDVAVNQQQWDSIADITDSRGRGVDNPHDREAADALVTQMPGLGLLLPVGDCSAVAIHDPIQGVLAVVHLGWKSTVAGLATKIVQHLQRSYRSSATDLRVYFSPAIKAESYIFNEVSQVGDPSWKDFLHKTDAGVGVDLPGYNRQRFIDAGVLPQHIEISTINTATSNKYYSHYRSVRAGEPEGRFALLAYLVG